ncbi:MFS transporter [Schlegelella sp. S2-27]|uniref:MFS transporter n=1 Tax=Caldimonas mangrovi TaxID=2944811 RepID=A0ABT0YI86_9BURK|nr:MFS transporter [Caldimonas mangrovi]MCM5678388.1 MFS transporter [Caldimonas mangrovi]
MAEAAAAPRELWRFAALSATYFAFVGYFNPYLPLWLKELGFGTFAIGALVAVQSITRVVAPYGWGWICDHTGQRARLLRLSSALACLFALGLLLTPYRVVPSVGYVGAVLFLMFLNTSAMMPMAEAAMAQHVSSDRGLDVARYGRIRVWGSIGFIVTVVVFGFWFEAQGLRWFAPGAALILLALVIACARLPAERPAVYGREAVPSLRPVLARPEVRWFFVSAFFMILGHISLYAFFSLHLDALGYSKRVVGALWAVSVMAEIAWFLWQGRWLGHWPLTTWLALTGVVAALRFGATAAFGASLSVLVVAQATHAVTFAAHHTVCIALINQHFPGRLRGRGQALYTVIGYGIPGVLGGVAGGALSDAAGFAAVFWAAGAVALLAALAAWRAASTTVLHDQA